MHISSAPLTPDDLPRCARLWPDRSAFTDAEFARALAACEALLRAERARAGVIREGNQLRAYGLSVFVHEAFADAYVATPHPQIGKRLLLEETERGAVLDLRDIAERNAGRGLQLVIVSSNYDVAARDPMLVVGEVIRKFMEVHRGYRIARIFNEAIGPGAVDVLAQTGVFEVHCRFPAIAPGVAIPSAVGILTREQAEARHNTIGGMFVYNPPRVLFTRAEQHLLRAALDGAPDEILSARLHLPLSAVKARWTRIHQRVAKCVPELVEHVRAPHASDRRGAQIRHLVLEFVRQNPSELTPYARRAADCQR